MGSPKKTTGAQDVIYVDSCMLQYTVGTKPSGAGGDAGAPGSALAMLTQTACYNILWGPILMVQGRLNLLPLGVGLLECEEATLFAIKYAENRVKQLKYTCATYV